MVQYAQNELLSITDFTKSISSIVKNIKNNMFDKVGILKNNKLEAVLISTSEYERLKSYEDIIENSENQELLKIAKDRLNTPINEYVSLEEMANKFNIDLKTI